MLNADSKIIDYFNLGCSNSIKCVTSFNISRELVIISRIRNSITWAPAPVVCRLMIWQLLEWQSEFGSFGV